MATNLQLDEDLIQDAVKLGNHPSKRAAVEEALQEYVRRRKQLEILELFGTLDIDESFDYKEARRSK